MTPASRKRALKLLDKIRRAEGLYATAWRRQAIYCHSNSVHEQTTNQMWRNEKIANAAYAELRALIEEGA